MYAEGPRRSQSIQERRPIDMDSQPLRMALGREDGLSEIMWEGSPEGDRDAKGETEGIKQGISAGK